MDYILKSRNDVAILLLDIIRPLKKYYSLGHAWLHVGNTGAHYGEKSTRMEGFSRVLWGLGPLFSQKYDTLPEKLQEEIQEWKEVYLEGIIHGTDPEHPEYWGMVADFDQKMVEMAAIDTAIMLAPSVLWDPLTEEQKQKLYTWLNQINGKGVHKNNWRFFRILTNTLFRFLGLPWNEERMKEDLAIIEECYDGDGWYYDGKPSAVDYYIPFAMEYYGLLYAHFCGDTDPEYGAVLKNRAGQFFNDFIYWFSSDGNEVPFGRSLTYRFAHSACFSAMALAEVENLDYGIAKGLALGNLRTWMKRPIFDEAGILTIGYGYPNLIMSERYNSPGSPYWSFKAFLMLALPEEHPFWQVEEKAYPYQKKKLLFHPHMLITHDDAGHVQVYPAGQHNQNHGNCAAKYEKFVYSNQFGFSVSRGTDLIDGAFDCTLAVSESGDSVYRMRYGIDDYKVTDDYVWTKYSIIRGVDVETVIVPIGAWHIRIHHIKTDREIDLADAGYSIRQEECFSVKEGAESGKYQSDMIQTEGDSAFAIFPWGVSGVYSLTGGEAVVTPLFPNTNLFYNLTVVPMIRKHLMPGEYRLITCVFGDCSENAETLAQVIPRVKVCGTDVQVLWKKTRIEIDISSEKGKSDICSGSQKGNWKHEIGL